MIKDSTIMVLGGWGLVGMAVCRQLLERKPKRLHVHSLRESEGEEARQALAPFAGSAEITSSSGDLFGLARSVTRREEIAAHLRLLTEDDLTGFLVYGLLQEVRPTTVVDCVNTATGIAYRNVFRSSTRVLDELDQGPPSTESVELLLESLYVPRLIRHIQVMYRGMVDAGTKCYVKVGTSGTGGMGLNIPYTHSEERPSRVLLSKSAMAGAHSMLLFLMARTPGAPITKEIKPAAAIAWKRIEHGPILRRGEPIRRIDARPRTLGPTFSTLDPDAAVVREEPLEAAYIDTGENGIFSIEEFSALTTARQMEFVTPEEIAQYLVFEIEGGNTGHDVMAALDNAVLGPTYRAGLMRHWALERLNQLQNEHGTNSIAFEMLGPPRLTKLLFEAHLLRLGFETMSAVRDAGADEIAQRLEALLRREPEVGSDVAAVGIPILLASGEIIRGPRVIVPAEAEAVPVDEETLERWVRDGWVDLRPANCARWIARFQAIHAEIEAIPPGDTSSHHLRSEAFWDGEGRIQPGKVVGWIFSEEEHGARIKR